MSKEIACPHCGRPFTLDPRDIAAATSSLEAIDPGLTVETMIPGTSSWDGLDAELRSGLDIVLPPSSGTISRHDTSPGRNGHTVDEVWSASGEHPATDAPVAQSPSGAETSAPLVEPPVEPNPFAEAAIAPFAGTAAAVPHSPSRTTDVDESSAEPDEPRRWPLGTVMLASYASAVTIACLWLLWQVRHPKDVVGETLPPDTRAEAGLRPGARRVAPIPESHRIGLGRTLIVDDLEVTPLTIGRGDVRLRRDGGEERDGGKGALILKLRLKNRSTDVAFSPLDEAFIREPDRRAPDTEIETADGARIAPFPLAVESEWGVAGQEIRELRPGEGYETILVSAPEVAAPKGRATWRTKLHTGDGKTAVVGITFGENDVK